MGQPWDLAALGMLASAVAGQPLSVRPAVSGQRTQATGREILLAPMSDLTAARQAVVCHALLLSIDGLHEPGLRQLIGQPRLCQRYMQWELARALACHGPRLPSSLASWLGTHTSLLAPGSSSQSIDWARDAQRIPSLRPWPSHLGIIRPAQATWQRLTGQQSARIGATSDGIDTSGDDTQEDALTVKVLRWFSSPLGGGSVSSLFLKLLGMSAPAKGQGTDLSAQGVAAALAGEHQVLVAPPADAQQCLPGEHHRDAATKADQSATDSDHYPEWFQSQGRYKPHWVTVREMTPPPTAAAALPEAARHLRIAGAALRQQMARIGTEFERHRGQPDGQDLDLDALVSHVVEQRLGGSGHGRLHQAARRTRRDLSLLVLLDISHSTGDRNEQGLRIIDQQIVMARKITQASTLLGDQVGVYAFHSWGRHLSHCLRIKGLGERSHQGQLEQRMNTLAPAGMTRLGAAIRHATALMARQANHSHRVILLLSDGFAYDDEYEGRHAQLDTAKALSEAQASGLGCVCLNIGSQQDDAVLKQLYGTAAYLRCADTRHAVPALGRLIRSALAGAGSGRMPHPLKSRPGQP